MYSINMLSSADKVKGQGVGAAYLEQVALVNNGLSDVESNTDRFR
jgi:1,2-diacylglycerol-3-alpha-glucose alpha-1,2-galactosyltransferase